MKRFRQLCLALGLVLSLCGLLVYRNEYLKLRSSFNYLDIFSGRNSIQVSSVINNVSFDSANSLKSWSEPSPQWTNIGNHYVYSAFNVLSDSQLTATAVGVGPRNNPVDYECHVWYEVADVLVSSAGKFGFSRHQSSDHLSVFEFFCEVPAKDVKGVPYMFVFIHHSDGNVVKSFVPIFTPKLSKNRASGVCILPDYIGETKQSLIEFLAFHHSIGIHNFVMYDNGMHHWIMSKTGEFSQLDGHHLNIVSLAWNFPYPDLSLNQELIELDCKYRSASLFNLIATLHLKQFLLPLSDKPWSTLTASDPDAGNSYEKVRLPSIVCCDNMKNDKRAETSWPLILRKTRCEKQLITSYVYVSSSPDLKLDLTLSSYTTCSDNQIKSTVYDDTAYNWQTQFLSNSLLKLWKSGRLYVKII